MPVRKRASVLATALLVHSAARAESGSPRATAKPQAPVEHRVDFRADRVELAEDMSSLDLSGAVVVKSHRFRLTAQSVTLSRTARGVHVEGKGELALCACADPPVTFGFGAADLAPPTDVLLQNATLRAGPVPVFWSPYLWLRSPTRIGLVPPSLAYRGEEGFLLGTGLHVPLAGGDGKSQAFDVTVGAYLRGGVRAETVLRGSSGRTALALDVFHGAALDVASAHALSLRGDAVLSERIDWLSGERALVAPAELSRVALGSDRARVAVGRSELGSFGVVFAADAPRDAAMGELGFYGPGLSLARGGAIGARSGYSIGLGTRSFQTPTGPAFVARTDAGLAASAPLASALYEVSLRQALEVLTAAGGDAEDLRSELRSRLGLPLARRYTALLHTFEPFAEAAVNAGARHDEKLAVGLSDLVLPSRSLVVLTGVDTALASTSQRGAVELGVGAGAVADVDAAASGVLAARGRLDAGVVRGAFDARWLPAERASELGVRAEAQTDTGLRLGLRLASASRDARAAAGFWGDDFARPKGAMLARSGVTAGGRLGVPWAGRILTEIGADVDISEKRWLSSSAALGYRHPCRCLSLLGSVSRRVGRNGFDLGVNVEIVPR